MALSNLTKDLILGLMGGDPVLQAEVVNGLQGGSGAVQANGSVPFTAPQSGITPVSSGQLATKGYVDTSVAGVLAGGLSVTITTAKLTGGGTNGSMTFTNGILTAQTAAT